MYVKLCSFIKDMSVFRCWSVQPAPCKFLLLAYLYKEITLKVFVCLFNTLKFLLSAARRFRRQRRILCQHAARSCWQWPMVVDQSWNSRGLVWLELTDDWARTEQQKRSAKDMAADNTSCSVSLATHGWLHPAWPHIFQEKLCDVNSWDIWHDTMRM